MIHCDSPLPRDGHQPSTTSKMPQPQLPQGRAPKQSAALSLRQLQRPPSQTPAPVAWYSRGGGGSGQQLGSVDWLERWSCCSLELIPVSTMIESMDKVQNPRIIDIFREIHDFTR